MKRKRIQALQAKETVQAKIRHLDWQFSVAGTGRRRGEGARLAGGVRGTVGEGQPVRGLQDEV